MSASVRNSPHLDAVPIELIHENGSAADAEAAIARYRSRGVEDLRLLRALRCIEVELANKLSVASLAEVATMSSSHFAAAFKACTGATVWSYVRRRRCAHARRLLTETRTPIALVAERCGFSHQQHLTVTLKRLHGVTPAALRRRALEETRREARVRD